MIKNTSGLAVQPCRLHERFYYHARLLYYILRQKARGFFARGCSPLAYRGSEGAGAPSALPNVGAQLPRPQRAGAPREHGFAMLGAPGDFMRDGSPSTHLLGAPPQTPGDFRFTTKVTKGVSGGAPLNPLGGHYHPPSGVAAPPRRTLPLGVVGGVGLCFPPRRIGVSGCRYPFLYSGKNCCEPGGEHRPYMADRGQLGYGNKNGNKRWEQSPKDFSSLYTI